MLTGVTDNATLDSNKKLSEEPKLDDVKADKHYTHPSPSDQPKRDSFTEHDDYISPSLVPSSEILLSPEQNSVLNRVKDGRSVFFTGSAGQFHSAC
jgi:hypothetical protein